MGDKYNDCGDCTQRDSVDWCPHVGGWRRAGMVGTCDHFTPKTDKRCGTCGHWGEEYGTEEFPVEEGWRVCNGSSGMIAGTASGGKKCKHWIPVNNNRRGPVRKAGPTRRSVRHRVRSVEEDLDRIDANQQATNAKVCELAARLDALERDIVRIVPRKKRFYFRLIRDLLGHLEE